MRTTSPSEDLSLYVSRRAAALPPLTRSRCRVDAVAPSWGPTRMVMPISFPNSTRASNVGFSPDPPLPGLRRLSLRTAHAQETVKMRSLADSPYLLDLQCAHGASPRSPTQHLPCCLHPHHSRPVLPFPTRGTTRFRGVPLRPCPFDGTAMDSISTSRTSSTSALPRLHPPCPLSSQCQPLLPFAPLRRFPFARRALPLPRSAIWRPRARCHRRLR